MSHLIIADGHSPISRFLVKQAGSILEEPAKWKPACQVCIRSATVVPTSRSHLSHSRPSIVLSNVSTEALLVGFLSLIFILDQGMELRYSISIPKLFVCLVT